MASLNKVLLIGHLGKDPELRFVQSGQAVANFSLATNEKWKDKEGNDQERVTWHRIVIWGRLAETVAQHLKKGSQIYLEGKIQTREWKTREGEKRLTTEVVGHSVQFLGGEKSQAPAGGDEPDPAPPPSDSPS